MQEREELRALKREKNMSREGKINKSKEKEKYENERMKEKEEKEKRGLARKI
jgi:hypothetical protein